MPTATLTSKGQITLPRSVKELFGILHRPDMHPASIEEIDEAIGRFHVEENERILRGGLPEH